MSEIDKDRDPTEVNSEAPHDDASETASAPKEKPRRSSGKRKAKAAPKTATEATTDAADEAAASEAEGLDQENKFKPSVLNAIDWNASAKQLDFLESEDSAVRASEHVEKELSAETPAVEEAESSVQSEGEPSSELSMDALESEQGSDRLESDAAIAASNSDAESGEDADTDSDVDAVTESDVEESDEISEPGLAGNLEFELESESEPELEAHAANVDETEGEPDGTAEEAPEEPEIPAELDQFASTQFVSGDQLISVIESLLFSTDKPVSVATIKTIFKGTNIRNKDIEFAIDGLAREYASPTRGVSLEEVNGGYQLRTKSDNAEFLRGLTKVRPFKLSGPALEVMSIVAYKQPVTKNEIDEIRGVESGHLLRALMERGLVYFAGKSELPGKPMTYGSTRKFLEIFGLRNIRELPTLSEIDELLPDGIGEVEEKETLADLTDSMSQSITSSYSEGEQELEKINEQLKSVDTTSEFFEQEKERERQRRDHERAQDIREKLVLGDHVEDKDKKWLARYEAKLLEPKVEPGAAASASEPSIGGELSNLSAETLASNSEAEASEVLKEADDVLEEDHGDDLTERLDWDDDSHSDDHGSDHDAEGM